MRLRDRLAGSSPPVGFVPLPAAERTEQPAEPDSPERVQRLARLRALIGEVEQRTRTRAERAPAAPAPRAVLPFGTRLDTAAGPLHLIERWFEPEHCHGRVAVRDALSTPPALLAELALEPALQAVDLSGMLIFDTETTGLAGGAGTVPFLIGLGWFEDGGFKLEQLFLPNFGAEAPLLLRLAERLRRASCIVSYNGKSFDWPLLRARFILNRIPLPDAPVHLDLLHCARRVLKQRLPNVRLADVERALLGFYREDDVNGALIPGMYLSYLRGGDPRALLPVFVHNEHDVLALAAILWRLCAHFASVRPEDDPRDHLAYARIAQRAGNVQRARAFAEAAAQYGEPGDASLRAHFMCATLARRGGDPAAAAAWLQRALSNAACEQSAARAHLLLARLYERQLKDPVRAQHHARFTLACEGAEAHGRRLERIRRRLERLSLAQNDELGP